MEMERFSEINGYSLGARKPGHVVRALSPTLVGAFALKKRLTPEELNTAHKMLADWEPDASKCNTPISIFGTPATS